MLRAAKKSSGKQGKFRHGKEIGRHIADLIEDGATLQLGIGGIPDAVLAQLDGKRHLGIHTEMVSDGVVKAIERVLSPIRRKRSTRESHFDFVLGSNELYAYVDNNPYFELHPCDYTNNPYVVSRNEKWLPSIHAFRLTLPTGVFDSMGSVIYSGFGGQVDLFACRRVEGWKTNHRTSINAKKGASHALCRT